MKKTYREKLLDVLRQLPDEALHNVMDEEWDKSVDEIDPDFIMLCGDVIQERHDKVMQPANQSPHKKRITKKTIIRMVAIAAVISMLIATLTFIFADSNREGGFNFSHVSVNFYKDKTMELDYSKIDAVPDGYFLPDSEKLSELKAGGITSLILPEVLFNDDYEITNIEHQETTGHPFVSGKTLHAQYNGVDISGDLYVTKKDDYYFLDIDPEDMVSSGGYVDANYGEEIVANGLDVIIIGFRDDDSYILEYYDRTQKMTYRIRVYGKYERVIEMAESIK